MGNTSIQWTDNTWNPVRGCRRVSPGCEHCYAERTAHRFSGPGGTYEALTRLGPGGPVWTGAIRTVPDKLDEPLTWRTPAKIFVNSMSDLFHDDVPFEFIDHVYATMILAHWHTFQVLTKRPGRMVEYFERSDLYEGVIQAADVIRAAHPRKDIHYVGISNPQLMSPRDIWLGASVESQKYADERIPLLRQVPAAVRFLSVEPLLERVDLSEWLDGIDWVIVGGESGPGARNMDVRWARTIVNQCRDANVPVFVKQMGLQPRQHNVHGRGFHLVDVDTERVHVLTTRHGDDWNEWPVDLRVRQFPAGAAR